MIFLGKPSLAGCVPASFDTTGKHGITPAQAWTLVTTAVAKTTFTHSGYAKATSDPFESYVGCDGSCIAWNDPPDNTDCQSYEHDETTFWLNYVEAESSGQSNSIHIEPATATATNIACFNDVYADSQIDNPQASEPVGYYCPTGYSPAYGEASQSVEVKMGGMIEVRAGVLFNGLVYDSVDYNCYAYATARGGWKADAWSSVEATSIQILGGAGPVLDSTGETSFYGLGGVSIPIYRYAAEDGIISGITLTANAGSCSIH